MPQVIDREPYLPLKVLQLNSVIDALVEEKAQKGAAKLYAFDIRHSTQDFVRDCESVSCIFCHLCKISLTIIVYVFSPRQRASGRSWQDHVSSNALVLLEGLLQELT